MSTITERTNLFAVLWSNSIKELSNTSNTPAIRKNVGIRELSYSITELSNWIKELSNWIGELSNLHI